MTSAIIGFTIQYQFVSSLRVVGRMGRVTIHPTFSVLFVRTFLLLCISPIVNMSCADIQSPREMEKHANEICAGSSRGTSTEAHAMTVCMVFLLTTVGIKSISRAPGQMIFVGHPAVLPTPVIA